MSSDAFSDLPAFTFLCIPAFVSGQCKMQSQELKVQSAHIYIQNEKNILRLHHLLILSFKKTYFGVSEKITHHRRQEKSIAQ